MRASATVDLARHVWNHPENARGGWKAQASGIARLAGWQVWQRAIRRPWTTQLPGGIQLLCYPHSPQASEVIYCRIPEYQDMHFVRDFLRPGDQFIDVGANIGVFSLLASSVPGTTVQAYEPSSTAYPRLEENIALNNLGHRIRVHRVAVGRAPGEVQITMGLGPMNHVVSTSGAGATASESVELVTLDETVADRGVGTIVKVDVEGFEEDVLMGAIDLITQARPPMIIEANDIAGVANVLNPIGYRAYSYEPARRHLEEVDWGHTQGNNILLIADLAFAVDRLLLK